MPLKLLCDGFEAMQGTTSADALRCEMEKFAREMGFETFTYALSVAAPTLSSQEVLVSAYPKEWVDRYVDRKYFRVDPVVTHCHHSTLPVIWDERVLEEPDTATATAREFWDEARSFGLHAGLSFAVHGQPGVLGIFSLSRDQALDLKGPELAALIGRAQIFASLLHDSLTRIHLPRLIPQLNVALTPRERECLKWAADGKTAWEIGQILGVTERTAIFHTNNVIQKLGAVNKTQAIVRALALKLL